jgi:hypothetical protein
MGLRLRCKTSGLDPPPPHTLPPGEGKMVVKPTSFLPLDGGGVWTGVKGGGDLVPG